MSRKFAGTLLGLFLFRMVLLLSTPSFDVFSSRVEINTKCTAVTQLKEAIFLWRQGVPLYELPCMPVPILVAIMSRIPTVCFAPLYLLLEAVLAYGLYMLAAETQSGKDTEHFALPKAAVLCYLVNPMTWMSTLAQNSSIWSHLGIIFGLLFAFRGRSFASIGCTMSSTYVSIYPVIFLIPTYFILVSKTGRPRGSIMVRLFRFVRIVLLWTSFYLSVSYWLAGSFYFVKSSYGCMFLLSDLTPNIGLYWYLFIEMFDSFRTTFLIIFHVSIFFMALSSAVKFYKDPLFVSYFYAALIALLKSYPCLSDLSLALCFTPFLVHLLPHTRKMLLATNTFIYSALLLPIFHYWWIYQGSGNANFYYAMTLVFSVAQLLMILDITWAKVYFDLLQANSKLKDIKTWSIIHH